MYFVKYLKIIFSTFAVALVLVGTGLIYAYSQLPVWLHEKAQEIGDKAGYVIDFKDFEYSIRDPKIRFSNFKIVQKSNQEELISIGQLEVSYRILPLLSQEIEIKRINASHLVLNVHKDPQLNFSKFIAQIEKIYPSDPKLANQPSKWLYSVNHLHVNDAIFKVYLEPKHFKNEFVVKDLNLTNIGNYNAKKMIDSIFQSKFQINLEHLKLNLPNSPKVLETGPMAFVGNLLLDQQESLKINLEADVEGGQASTSLSMSNQFDDLDIEMKLAEVSLVPLLQMAAPKSARTLKSGSVTGTLHYLSDLKKDHFKGQFTVKDVNIPPLLELLPANIKLVGKSGKADGILTIEDTQNKFQVSGNVNVKDLAIFEMDKTNELLAWKIGSIKHFEYEEVGKDSRLRMDEVLLDGLKARVTIYADKSNNFMRMFPPSAKEAMKIELARQIATLQAESENNDQSEKIKDLKSLQLQVSKGQLVDKNSGQFNANIKSIAIKNSAVNFTDFSVLPVFKTQITGLRGTVVGISTKPKRYATAAFDGLVGPQGDVKIRGQIAFEDPRRNNDIQLSFRRIPLATINPYYSSLAGYDVVDGILSYDSSYQTKDGKLVGDNRFVINQIQMGDRNPNYKGIFIPMKLITSLLEDKDGVIDLNLKVQGNVDSPEFQISKLLWDAFFTIISNVVKSPFIGVGRLLGFENLNGIYFSPGSDQLRPSETLKLEKIATGLEKKPKLFFRINGAYDASVDTIELATSEVNRQIFKRGGFSVLPNEPLPKIPLSDDRIQRAIKRLFEEGGIPLPNSAGVTPGIATEKYFAELHQTLIQRVTVTEADLQQLAHQRATIVQQDMAKNHPQLKDRVKVDVIKNIKAESDGIPMGVAFIN